MFIEELGYYPNTQARALHNLRKEWVGDIADDRSKDGTREIGRGPTPPS
jgi:DNA-binding LacI/PurR family transcriptional regulator